MTFAGAWRIARSSTVTPTAPDNQQEKTHEN